MDITVLKSKILHLEKTHKGRRLLKIWMCLQSNPSFVINQNREVMDHGTRKGNYKSISPKADTRSHFIVDRRSN